jgi:hypothetical protein
MKLQRALTDAELKQIQNPQLRLFASVDLEGSTAFKQALPDGGSRRWLSVVLDFVEAFEKTFWTHIGQEALKLARSSSPSQPRLWKILGDELVFDLELRSATEACVYVEALVSAVAEWNRDVMARRKTAEGPGERPLLVKGAAWVAEFPVTNAILPVAENHHDYIGPSMDTGFRLTKLASPRRLALSVELAWLLLRQNPKRPVEFAGRTRDLKGVASASGYPQFWIEVPSSDYHAQEHALLKSRRCDLPGKKLRKLCECFIRDFGVPSDLPHVPKDTATPEPSGYLEKLREAQADLAIRYLATTETETAIAPQIGSPSLTALLASLDALFAKDAAKASRPRPPPKPTKPKSRTKP